MSTVVTTTNTTAEATSAGEKTAPKPIELLKVFNLQVPINTPQGKLESFTLRRPKVREMVLFQSQAKKLGLDDAEEELLIYANLSEEKLTSEDLGELDFGDFAKVQRWFRSIQT